MGTIFLVYVDMCMCESDHRWRPPRGGILYSTHDSSLPEKNTIRIIITRIYNFFQSLNVIDEIIICDRL